ncbi:GroES-like protein [Marasmius fiardii PR-910]|nr:GroES-like protein [Marasmius fiardii PR-910]
MSQQQQALVVPSKGSPYTLISKPIPTPGPAEVLVRLEGVALNPIEYAVASIPAFAPMMEAMATHGGGWPAYTGTDGAGTVVEVGSEVDQTRLKKGDRVVFQGVFKPNYSTYQQYTLIPHDLAAKIPPNVSSLEAASIPMALATAGFDLNIPSFLNGHAGAGIHPFWEDDARGIKSGEPIVVLGGSSSVGQLAVQIASHLGYSPLIVTSSLKHADYLKSLGATHVIDRHIPIDALPSAVQEIVQGKPIKYMFNAVRPTIQTYLDVLAPGGTFIESSLIVPPEIVLKDGRKIVLTIGSIHVYKDLSLGLMSKLQGLLERGIIKPNRIEKLPGGLAGIPDGLKRFRLDQVSGVKLVVDPRETP